LTTFLNFFYFDCASQLWQQILWNKFYKSCAYFNPNCTWSPNYSVLVSFVLALFWAEFVPANLRLETSFYVRGRQRTSFPLLREAWLCLARDRPVYFALVRVNLPVDVGGGLKIFYSKSFSSRLGQWSVAKMAEFLSFRKGRESARIAFACTHFGSRFLRTLRTPPG
jgi:hypothetical protein